MAITVIKPFKEAYPLHKWYTSGHGYVLTTSPNGTLGLADDLKPIRESHLKMLEASLTEWESMVMQQLNRLDVTLQYAIADLNTNSLVVRGRPKVAYISVQIPLKESKPVVVTIDKRGGEKEEYTQHP